MLSDGGCGRADNRFSAAHFPWNAGALGSSDLRMVAADEIIARSQMQVFVREIFVVGNYSRCDACVLQCFRDIVAAPGRCPLSDKRVELFLVLFARFQSS